MNIPHFILHSLETCPIPRPGEKWRYAYDLMVGAAASLLSAHPYYAGTSHYGHKRQYTPRSLYGLLLGAHDEAVRSGRPIDLYHVGLEGWTAGYFFNSGIVRIGCSYEYSIHTACAHTPYASLSYIQDTKALRNGNSPDFDQQLDVFESFSKYPRAKLHQQTNRLIRRLVTKIAPERHAQVGVLYERLETRDDEFLKAALYFVWCDYNWFKHRPMGYRGSSNPRRNDQIQFALALRAFRSLCQFYSICRARRRP
jgi:hypothetical protein